MMNQGLSLIRLSKAGPAHYLGAQIQEEVKASIQGIKGVELDPEFRGKVSPEDDKVLIGVMKAAVGENSADLAAAVSIWNGKAKGYITRAREFERVLNQYGDYIPVLTDYKLDSFETLWGKQVDFKQQESIEELARRLNGLTGKQGKNIVWPSLLDVGKDIARPSLLEVLGTYYGKGTAPGEDESFRSVIPFVVGTNKKPYFGEEGQLIELNIRGLVAADYGVTAGALMLDLFDQGFPNASVPWKISRALINKAKSGVGDLCSYDDGVYGYDYIDADADADVFAAGSEIASRR